MASLDPSYDRLRNARGARRDYPPQLQRKALRCWRTTGCRPIWTRGSKNTMRHYPDFAPGEGIHKVVRNEIFKQVWNEIDRLDQGVSATSFATTRSSWAA